MMLTCKRCGEVHMGVSRADADREVATFNSAFKRMSPEEQQMYGGVESTILEYEHCSVCMNGYKNFRQFRPGDCPDGCTVGPIIEDDDEHGHEND